MSRPRGGHAVSSAVPVLVAVALIGCGGHAPSPGTPTDMYARARDLYDRGKWDKARQQFEALIFSYPGASMVDSAQFLLAMCHYRQKDFILATDEFRRLRTRYPGSVLIEEADLMRCRALLKTAPRNSALDQEKTREAITQIRQFRDDHPLSPLAPAADSLLREANGRLSERDFKAGVLYHRMGHYQAARMYFQELIDRYTDSPLVPEALYYIAEGQRRLDSTRSAIAYYEKLIYVYPDHPRTAKARERVARLARRQEAAQTRP